MKIFLVFIFSSSLGLANLNFATIKYKSKKKKVEYYILTSQFDKAKAILDSNSGLFQEQESFNKYRLIINFLRTSEATQTKEVTGKNDKEQRLICTLNIFNQIKQQNFKGLYNKWKRCSNFISQNNAPGEVYLNTLLEYLSLNDVNPFSNSAFKQYSQNKEEAQAWFKASHTLKQSKKTEPLTLNLPLRIYQSNELKEVLTSIYYESKEIQLAKTLSTSLEKESQEILDANIFILKRDFKKSYEKFKKYMFNKHLSNEELTKAIFLAFINDDYSSVVKLVDHYEKKNQNIPTDFLWKKALAHLALADSVRAKQTLNVYLTKIHDFGLSQLFKVRQIMAMQEGDELETNFYARRNCLKNDKASCWILLKENGRIKRDPIKIELTSLQDVIQEVSRVQESVNAKGMELEVSNKKTLEYLLEN